MPTGNHKYRFVDVGVTAQQVESMVPGSTTIHSVVVSPLRYCDLQLEDNSVDPESDAAAGMLDRGFTLLEVDPTEGVIQVPAQIISAKLTADAASIVPADGWVDVFATQIATKGDSSLSVLATPIFTCSIGGEYRLLFDGGSPPDEVLVDPTPIQVLSTRRGYPVQSPVSIPASGGTTYTVKLQAQAVGLLSSVVPKKDSVLTLVEYRGV